MLRLLYRTRQSFVAKADLEGLLAIRQAGFHVCRNLGAYTDHEEYVALEPQVLRMMWNQVTDLSPQDWRYTDLQRIWDAYYVLSDPGQYDPESERDNRAAICNPWTDFRHWYLRLSLYYFDTHRALGKAAVELIGFILDHEAYR